MTRTSTVAATLDAAYTVALRAVSEEQFQRQIIDLATLYGWPQIYHTHDSRRSAKGYPDLTIAGFGRLIYAELKTETGRVSAEQQGWLDTLKTVPGVEVYLWRPHDWDSILATLTPGKARAARAALEGERT